MFVISKQLMKKVEMGCVNGFVTHIKVINDCFVKGCFGDPPGCYGCSSECVSTCEGGCRGGCKGGCANTCVGEVR